MSAYGKTAVTWPVDSTPRELASALRVLAEDYPIFEDNDNGLKLKFEKASVPGICRTLRKGDEVTIQSDLNSMAMRAVGTVLAGLVEDGTQIDENVTFEKFGIMLDNSRNAVMTVTHFKKWLRRLALLGYNTAYLYCEDTYEIKDEPYFGYLRGKYTREELRAIDDYAYSLGIEIVPCIQTLGHLEMLLRWCGLREVRDTGNILLVDEPKTYELIEKMILAWKNSVRSNRFHVGMDETHGLGTGQFLQKNGYENPFHIINRHLERVCEICRKHKVEPIMWSDMWFRFGSKDHDYYDLDAVIPQDVKNKIPKDVTMVYWDYYHTEQDFYERFIDLHFDINRPVIMGSGVWTWAQMWYRQEQTENSVKPCIEACKRKKIPEIFFTLWGDDGAICDFDSALAGLAWAAEQAFSVKFSPAIFEPRFKAICKADYNNVCIPAELQMLTQTINPLLYDDPIMQIIQRGMRLQDPEFSAKAARFLEDMSEKIRPHTNETEAGKLSHALALTEFLAVKLRASDELYKNYLSGNLKGLRVVKDMAVEVVNKLEALLHSFRDNWLGRNKPYGLDTIQRRFGGQIYRWIELKARLEEYITGRIRSIPEIEEVTPQPEETMRNRNYGQASSASGIY